MKNVEFSFIRNGSDVTDPTFDKTGKIAVDPYYTYGEHQLIYVDVYINDIAISIKAEEFNEILKSMKKYAGPFRSSDEEEDFWRVWEALGDVPIDENENIESVFLQFEIGTGKYDIWHWIEEKYNIILGNIIYKKDNQNG